MSRRQNLPNRPLSHWEVDALVKFPTRPQGRVLINISEWDVKQLQAACRNYGIRCSSPPEMRSRLCENHPDIFYYEDVRYSTTCGPRPQNRGIKQ